MPKSPSHSSLVIHEAQARCDRVLVVLGADTREPVLSDVREQWKREAHPDVVVRNHWAAPCPVDYASVTACDAHVGALTTVLHEPVDGIGDRGRANAPPPRRSGGGAGTVTARAIQTVTALRMDAGTSKRAR